ncbi:hypothetical protein C8Q70DRAFT_455497 [Cubamyces menziesii]|uniref:Uncharacterized protein n=1 Tax=Trametes cubensis TaxID=1111947 RepID=A0AAD7X9A6_9APHY|nr:hypothetical protein C8Q70DRAFT_455497 [Cubamyces menziesii]KAJ8463823.1 hypothetical protein ONZ51_g10001 [Trametes cubensis]
MATPLANIVLGTVVFTRGITVDPDDIAIDASSKSRSGAISGRDKHFGVIIGKDATGIVVVGSATLGGAHQLVGTVKKVSLPYWIPVTPATKEPGMAHEPVTRTSGNQEKPTWINVRQSYNIPGAEFNISDVETYSLATVNIIRAALHLPPVA